MYFRVKCVTVNNNVTQVQKEIFDVEKNLDLMRKAIADKSHATKVAHTRMEARMHRPDVELCRDYAYVRFVCYITCFEKEDKDMRRFKLFLFSF